MHGCSGYAPWSGLTAGGGRPVVAIDDEYASVPDAGLRLVTAQAARRAG